MAGAEEGDSAKSRILESAMPSFDAEFSSRSPSFVWCLLLLLPLLPTLRHFFFGCSFKASLFVFCMPMVVSSIKFLSSPLCTLGLWTSSTFLEPLFAALPCPPPLACLPLLLLLLVMTGEGRLGETSD